MKTLTRKQRILQFIQDNPGCKHKDIFQFEFDYQTKDIPGIKRYLKRKITLYKGYLHNEQLSYNKPALLDKIKSLEVMLTQIKSGMIPPSEGYHLNYSSIGWTCHYLAKQLVTEGKVIKNSKNRYYIYIGN